MVNPLVRVQSRQDLRLLWENPEGFSESFAQLWAGFSATAGSAFEEYRSSPIALRDGSAVIRIFAWLVQTSADLNTLCAALPADRDVRELLTFYVKSDVADDDVIRSLLREQAFPWPGALDPEWMEVALWRQAVVVLNRYPERKFRLDELVPAGLESDDSTVRAIVGTAVDEGQLQESEFPKVLELFPSDRYLATRLGSAQAK